MIIWLVGAILILVAAALGYLLGGIRTAVCLVGTLVAAYLAKTVGGWVNGLVPLMGFHNPIWQFYLPPLLGFIIVSLLFSILAFVIHHLVHRRSRDSSDEYSYARWFRLNRRTGAAVGAALGTVWLVLLGIVVYVPAYLTTQLADTEEDSGLLRAVNSFAHGMEDTGLLRIVQRYQPAGAEHYLAADVLGLVYTNPALESRLASYPPFLGLAEKPEIAELGRDPEVNTLIQSRAGLLRILEHPKVRAVADSPELVNDLLELDLADLDSYLRTGISDKYKDQHLLGLWRLDVRRSIAEMKLVGSDKLPPIELNLLRRALNVYMEEMTIGFTTDNRALLKVKVKDEQKMQQILGHAAPAPSASPAPGQTSDSSPPPAVGTGRGYTPRSLVSRALPQPADPGAGMDPALRARYFPGGTGAAGGGGAAAGARTLASTTGGYYSGTPVRASTSTVLAPLMTNRAGTWSKSAEDKYRLQFPADDGKEVVLDARVRENQLVATVNGRTLVFDRI